MNRIENWFTPRRYFEPSSNEDVKLFRKFLHDMKWGKEGCPFILEWPFEDIPYMVKTKLTDYYLKGVK